MEFKTKKGGRACKEWAFPTVSLENMAVFFFQTNDCLYLFSENKRKYTPQLLFHHNVLVEDSFLFRFKAA